jgi:hypothetical protein
VGVCAERGSRFCVAERPLNRHHITGTSLFTAPRGGADPQHEVCGVPGQLDDLISRHAGHGRAGDRASEPVLRLDELVLRPLVVREGPSSDLLLRPRGVSN